MWENNQYNTKLDYASRGVVRHGQLPFLKIAGTFLQLFEKNAAKFPQFFCRTDYSNVVRGLRAER